MIPLSPRESVSLLLFGLAILAICGLEIGVLVRAVYRRSKGRSARRILLAVPAIVLHLLLVTVLGCMLYAYFIEPNWIEVHSLTLHTPKLKAETFRIVQISDLHCDVAQRNEERAVQIINGLKPDVVVATGDYLNHKAGLPRLRQMLCRFEAPLGKFAVTGNFEVLRWRDLNVLAESTFRTLERETVVVTKGQDAIAVTGAGYFPADVPSDPIGGFSDDRFDLFLFHTPDLIEDVSHRGVDLYLCGHTHGGQICLPWYGALITFSKFGKKYESGMHRVGDTVLYVNRGLGMEPRPAPQMRFLARPQIVVVDVCPQ
ncbi:MAG: metallophosphoesterase [Planctomycetes bacterium]|nr:metallophosphoesterase [Planctomycetota bacterium]